MKKRILIVLLFTFILSGCRQSKEIEDVSYNARFVVISREKYGEVVFDEKTGVEYWRSYDDHNNGSLTLLVDKNGNPLIYRGD